MLILTKMSNKQLGTTTVLSKLHCSRSALGQPFHQFDEDYVDKYSSDSFARTMMATAMVMMATTMVVMMVMAWCVYR